jgi:DNA topoisomerase IA
MANLKIPSEKLTARLIQNKRGKAEPENETQTIAICDDIKKTVLCGVAGQKGFAKRQSPPTFITSSLQQEAFTKLWFQQQKNQC